MVRAIAPAKILLFGDHAAVYGYPAIAMAIDKSVFADFSIGYKESRIEAKFPGDYKVVRDLPLGSEEFYDFAKEHLKSKNLGQLTHPWYRPVQLLTGKFEHDNEVFVENTYMINFGCVSDWPNLPKGCGVGSAIGAALSASMHGFFFKKVDKDAVLDDALFFESMTHGPERSGLDAHTIVKGGYFCAFNGEVKRVNGIRKQYFLLVDSGIHAETSKQIQTLESVLDANPSAKSKLEEIGNIAARGIEILKSNDTNNNILRQTGKLMYENHSLLQDLEMSCVELDLIVELSKKYGAWGAKMTGAGGGGAAIVVGKDLNKIRHRLFDDGFKSFIASTNFNGVEIVK